MIQLLAFRGLLNTLRIKPKLLMYPARLPMTGPHLPWSHLLSIPTLHAMFLQPGASIIPHTSLASCLCLCCPLGLLSRCTFSSSITSYRKSSLILIASKLGRCPSAPGSHRILSLSWPLLCYILASVSAPTELGVP